MEVPKWMKNIWSRPERNNYAESLVPRGLLNNNNNSNNSNNYAESLVPRGLLNNNNNSNNTRKNNTNKSRFNASAPEFVPAANQESQPVSLPRTLNPNAPDFSPSTGGKRRRHRSRKVRKTRRRSKAQRH
jgi:hypothetical protein